MPIPGSRISRIIPGIGSNSNRRRWEKIEERTEPDKEKNLKNKKEEKCLDL
jgi:hypothetical protein